MSTKHEMRKLMETVGQINVSSSDDTPEELSEYYGNTSTMFTPHKVIRHKEQTGRCLVCGQDWPDPGPTWAR